jgi:hypothetical protein
MVEPPRGVAGVAWGVGALAGFSGFVLAVLALDVLQPELSPTTEAVSYYVHGRYGPLATGGLLSLGLGSLALLRLLQWTYLGSNALLVRAGVGLWGAFVLVAAVFPADPRGSWSGPPSTAGIVHGLAALLAFLALPLATLAMARGVRADPHWRGARAYLAPLGVLCPVALGAFFASLWPTLGAERPPVLLGLTERVLLAVNLSWLGASAFRAMRVVANVPARRPAPGTAPAPRSPEPPAPA